jgi:hypothetical protein
MKKMSILIVITALLTSVFSNNTFAASAQEVFDRLLSLSGTWDGEYKGKDQSYPMRLTYTPISGKAAVMETMDSLSDGSSMVTIYHTNGNKLMATHYCKGNNQPRLAAEVPAGDPNKLDFHFVDGTNLGASYVSDISFEFIDDNTLVQTTRFKGNDTVAAVRYTRGKK